MFKIFCRTFRVRLSEVDVSGQVGAAHYLRYLAETALDWGAAGGLGLDDIQALGQVWVIREAELSFIRPLRYNDVFEFTIWLLRWRRVRGTRAFELKLRDGGEVVAQGVQQVAVLDAETMRPTALPDSIVEYYRLEDPRVLPEQRFPRVPPPPEAALVMERQVEARDLDTYDMVNNAVYVAYAEEAGARALAAAGWSPARLKSQGLAAVTRRLHIQYQSPASWGDRLRVVTYLLDLRQSGGTRYVTIEGAEDGRGIAECTVEWALVDRASGKGQPLPEPLRLALQAEVPVAG
jgi:YbgC/YbaW family acyl-CoA thioester hydrolase